MNKDQRRIASGALYALAGVFFVAFLIVPFADYQRDLAEVKTAREEGDLFRGLFSPTPKFSLSEHALMGIVAPLILAGLGGYVRAGGGTEAKP